MTSAWTWIAIIVFAGIGLYVLNRPAFRRAKAAASAQVSKASQFFWQMDPIAVKNAEIDRKAEDLAEATRGLEKCRALVSSVERQVREGKAESNRLQALAEQYIKEGNDAKAKEKLIEKTRVDRHLISNEEQLSQHREMYDNYLVKIQSANKSIAELRAEAKRQGVRLQMAKAEANLAKLGNFMGRMNVSFDSLSEIDQEIESQIDANHAKGQVALDLSKEGLEELEAENRAASAAADTALADLKSKVHGKFAVHDPRD